MLARVSIAGFRAISSWSIFTAYRGRPPSRKQFMDKKLRDLTLVERKLIDLKLSALTFLNERCREVRMYKEESTTVGLPSRSHAVVAVMSLVKESELSSFVKLGLLAAANS